MKVKSKYIKRIEQAHYNDVLDILKHTLLVFVQHENDIFVPKMWELQPKERGFAIPHYHEDDENKKNKVYGVVIIILNRAISEQDLYITIIHELLHILDYKEKFKDMLRCGFWTEEDGDPEVDMELEQAIETKAIQIVNLYEKNIRNYIKRKFPNVYKYIQENLKNKTDG